MFVAAALVAAFVQPFAVADDASPLVAWVGRYPSDDTLFPKGPRRVWQLPQVRAALRSHLTPNDRQRITRTYAVETPVTREGDLIIISNCQPHACPAAHAIGVFETGTARVWWGFFERSRNSVSTRWYGTDPHEALPSSILKAFEAAHGGVR